MKPTLSIAGAIATFPPTFGLRGFPGLVFRISESASYVSGDTIMLYTQVSRDGQWLDFAKGTIAELRSQIHLVVGRQS